MDIPNTLKHIIIYFIFFLPFQRTLTIFIDSDDNSTILKVLGILDELSLLLLFVFLLTFFALRPSKFSYKLLDTPISKPLIAFILVAIYSLIYNNVPLGQGLFGIADIIKNILLFYLIAALPWEENDLYSIVRGIVVIVLVLAIVGIVAEVFAKMGGGGIGYLTRFSEEDHLRLGLYRVSSLVGVGQINYLAIYGTLAFFIVLQAYQGSILKYITLVLIGTLIFLTFSRQGWACFILMLIMRRKLYLIWAIPVILLAAFMTVLSGERFEPEVYFRGFTYLESIQILIDNPFIGVGPGVFGDLASILYDSSIYDAWPKFFREFAYKIRGIDCFWPVIWAEFGIIGFVSFASIFYKLFRYIGMVSNFFSSSGSYCMKEIASVIKNYVLVIVLMSFATGFNTPFVVYTFFSLAAILYSIYLQQLTDRIIT